MSTFMRKISKLFDQVCLPFNNMLRLYMPFYIKNVKLLGWDKCVKKVFKKYFMIKITHNVSITQLALYDYNAIIYKKTRASDIMTSV